MAKRENISVSFTPEQASFLYRIIDLYSRKIVGWEVHEVENSAQAQDLVEQACPARSRRGVA